MKVLFDKIARYATITSEQEDVSFPAVNLAHQYATVYYKSTSFDDVITMMFDDQRPVNSIFFTYSNASSMTVKLYQWNGVLLDTITVDCSHASGSAYFDEQLVRWAVIEASAPVTEDLRIGSIEFGIAKDFPLPTANFVPVYESKSTMEESDQGQVSFQYIEPRKKYVTKYQGVVKETYLEVLEMFQPVDRGHIWVDITEEDHNVYLPLYCVTNLIENGERIEDRVSFTITITEAK